MEEFGGESAEFVGIPAPRPLRKAPDIEDFERRLLPFLPLHCYQPQNKKQSPAMQNNSSLNKNNSSFNQNNSGLKSSSLIDAVLADSMRCKLLFLPVDNLARVQSPPLTSPTNTSPPLISSNGTPNGVNGGCVLEEGPDASDPFPLGHLSPNFVSSLERRGESLTSKQSYYKVLRKKERRESELLITVDEYRPKSTPPLLPLSNRSNYDNDGSRRGKTS